MRFPDKSLKIPESDFDPDSLLSLDPEPFLCFLASAYEKCKINKKKFHHFHLAKEGETGNSCKEKCKSHTCSIEYLKYLPSLTFAGYLYQKLEVISVTLA